MAKTQDEEFEKALSLIRDTYLKRLSSNERTVSSLKTELLQNNSELQSLHSRIAELQTRNSELSSRNTELLNNNSNLEAQLARSDKRIAEMSKAVSKLANFKQSVIAAAGAEAEFGLNISESSASIGLTNVNRFSQPEMSSFRSDRMNSNFSGTVNTVDLDANIPDTTLRMYSKPAIKLIDREDHHSRDISSSVVNEKRNFPQQIIVESPRKANGVTFAESEYRTPQLANNQLPSVITSGINTHQQQPSAVDGREFFKKARTILSYDEFTTLLWNVRTYNNREQSRQRTLDNLSELLSDRNRELFEQFERLLSR
ncbi:hypothetical protein HK096_009953 [Nowakowskiella sp. JEL0078]|nr:hypothetical protein HK096_009953 [Nowakowskiella sp. JEL0078]